MSCTRPDTMYSKNPRCESTIRRDAVSRHGRTGVQGVIFASLLCLLSLAPEVAFSQRAGAFSRLGFGARGIAMGNALAADISGGVSPYYNPALAPFATGQNLEASVALLSFDRSLQFLQISAPFEKRAGIALGLIHSSVTNIDGRDNSGFHTRDLSVDEFAGFMAFGIRFGGAVTGGIGLQFFRSDLFDGLKPATSVGIDVGLTIRLAQTVSLGLVADDLLARYTWDTSSVNGSGGKSTTDNFPRRIRVGLMKTLKENRLRLVGEIESRVTTVEVVTSRVDFLGDEPIVFTDRNDLSVQETRLRVGAEYAFTTQFVGRAGIEQLGKDAFGGIRPSAGFMVEQQSGMLRMRLEYTFGVESRASGTMHILSMQLFL